MKLFSSKKRVAAIGAITAATLVTGGVAVAYWSASGSGTGVATTETGTANLSFAQAGLTAMYPGDESQALVVTVTNDASTNAFVGAMTATVTTDVPGCDGSDFLINGTPADTAVDLNWDPVDIIPAGSESTSSIATDPDYNTIQFNNKGEPQDECKAIDGTPGNAVHILYEVP